MEKGTVWLHTVENDSEESKQSLVKMQKTEVGKKYIHSSAQVYELDLETQ